MTFRVEPELEKAFAALARKRGLSRSELFRSVVKRMLDDESRRGRTLYEQLKPIIGIGRLGPEGLARLKKGAWREHLIKKHGLDPH